MASFIIEGGHPLSGEITPQGAKNEALQIVCAVLLTDEPVIVHNVPDIVDIRRLIKILSSIGVEVTPLGGGSIRFQARQIDLEFMKTKDYVKLSGKIRASIMTIGPLLGRFGVAYASAPGGDKIGRRPLTTHFEGFEKLGATMSHHKGMIYKLKAAPLKGCYMLLNEASVTGTANLVMAAVLAKGTTTIFNAACEPYLLQLCRMLNRMGAKISGLGSNLLTIEGVEKLHGCEHTVLPDMIEIGSFIGMAALNRSEITIKDCSWENLGIIPYTFSKLGIKLEQRGDDIFVPKQNEYVIERQMDGSILTIADAPWPGFTPDLISIALVTAVQGKGSVLIHQKMFESRLFFVDSLQSMGAQIILCDPHRATVIGLNHQIPLRATKMASPDIRAGVALLIAALSAEGTSVIQNVEQIDRGYQDIVNRLNSLGANIIRED
ncbi:MAG TPA: UDP-N-acetylglucosamine 1-carboxyvinyltransferase [Bacteroidales bacterium]|nr:UDP-N-acetylglucosamine 1-carboxyvinyltransferase [Bacteroidales bacterium]HOH22883.1 UDP-N-acetylglucosamine 1-carboxyvinyltransferase [Bacteroidales bacterium]HPZ04092.1 UDP-N-acetylglucosamine 1-carboxyvinyltransferase [Bacteroidales bacterium]HQB75702.1 UDP-N-acetylglucosamine 1-carboxyvinyltransferase [Bacteroidales bacterium]